MSSSFTEEEDEGSEGEVTSSPCDGGWLVDVCEGGDKGDKGPKEE